MRTSLSLAVTKRSLTRTRQLVALMRGTLKRNEVNSPRAQGVFDGNKVVSDGDQAARQEDEPAALLTNDPRSHQKLPSPGEQQRRCGNEAARHEERAARSRTRDPCHGERALPLHMKEAGLGKSAPCCGKRAARHGESLPRSRQGPLCPPERYARLDQEGACWRLNETGSPEGARLSGSPPRGYSERPWVQPAFLTLEACKPLGP